MKKLQAFIPVLILALILSGCSFRLFSTAEELIYPVSPSGENANVQKALDTYFKNGYSLKTPISGEYKTSYIFYDIDADAQEEALVFCEPSANPGTVTAAVIDKSDSGWNVVCSIEGTGSDVYSVDFCDLNGDNKPEIVMLWDTFNNSTSHILSVYRQIDNTGEFSLVPFGKPITMNNYISVDIEKDGFEELLVLTVDSGDSISADAVLYSYRKNNPVVLGSTKLDGHISSYKNIVYENADGRIYVYADAVKSNGSQMLTEVILWSDYYDTIISPLYSYYTGITKETTRSARLSSQDVNDDGKIEIPLDAKKDGLPVQVEAVNWNTYKDSVMIHACYSAAVEKNKYQVIIPDAYFDAVQFFYDDENSVMTVKDKNGNAVFEIASVLSSVYNADKGKYSGYTEIMNHSGYIYLAQSGENSDIKITAEDLKSMIKSYEGE